MVGGLLCGQVGGGSGKNVAPVLGAVGGGSVRTVTQSIAPTVGQKATVEGSTLRDRGSSS